MLDLPERLSDLFYTRLPESNQILSRRNDFFQRERISFRRCYNGLLLSMYIN